MNVPFRTILSSPAEWHALGLGVFVGVLLVIGQPALAGTVLAAIAGAQIKRETHLADAKRELGYLAGGALAVLAGSTVL